MVILTTHHRAIVLIPFLFVLLWSTGFIGAKYALPYIEPFHLLFYRMLLNLVAFAFIIWWWNAKRLTLVQIGHQSVVGLCFHAGYLGGVFAAIEMQMPAGLVALVVGLQPLLTAFIMWLAVNERLQLGQWLGLFLGVIGIALVLSGSGRLDMQVDNTWALIAAGIALLAISIGTLYQKHYGGGADLLTGSFYQYFAAAIVLGPIAWHFETGVVDWQWPLILSLAWLVLGLSVAAVLLLLFMLREGESSRVASYFYLIPPVTVFEGWLLFDEQLGLMALFGVVVTILGVYLVLQPKR